MVEKAPSHGFQPSRPVRAYEGVVRQVEEAIFRGTLRPGDRLPSERELVTQFDVSRATIREALRVLESSGMVRSRPGDPGGGARVQPFSPEKLHRSMEAMVRLEHFDLAELVQFRMIIEGSATYLAAIRHTDAQRAEMLAAHHAMRKAIAEGYEAFSRADVAFHATIADGANSGLLRICNEVARAGVLELIKFKFGGGNDDLEVMQDSCARHERVLDALVERDGETAALRAQQDLVDHFGRFVPASQRAELDELARRRPLP